ncbi:hypothetical protein C8J57DRAFT_1565918 [Mycena rebaudengoi]|nr:hypothetical protein C8J57DRAFT_1565918 [Mycena rebaudengoi]
MCQLAQSSAASCIHPRSPSDGLPLASAHAPPAQNASHDLEAHDLHTRMPPLPDPRHWLRDPRRPPCVDVPCSQPMHSLPAPPALPPTEVTARDPRPTRGPTPHVTTATKIARHATRRRYFVPCDASLLHRDIAAVLVPVPFFAPTALQLLPRPRPPPHRNQYLAPPRPQWHATPPHQKDTVALHRRESRRCVAFFRPRRARLTRLHLLAPQFPPRRAVAPEGHGGAARDISALACTSTSRSQEGVVRFVVDADRGRVGCANAGRPGCGNAGRR